MHKIKFLLVLLSISLSLPAQNNTIAPFRQDSTYTFNTLQKVAKEGFFSTYRSELGITAHDSFALHNCEYTRDKKFSCRYTQYHKGYLVEGSHFLLHGERGIVFYAAGNQMKQLDVPVSNPISGDSALAVVLRVYDTVTFDYQVDSLVSIWRETSEDSTYTGYPLGELLISAPQNNNWQASGYRLMWKFMLSTVVPQRQNISVYVDALTGVFVNGFDRSDYGVYGTGTVKTIYNGWQSFTTYRCGLCTNWTLKTDNGIGTFRNGKKLKDDDNTWSDYEEQNFTTVHWATERAWRYFYDRHGRNGSDHKGMRLDNHGNLDVRYASYSIGDAGEDRIRVGKRINGVSPATLDILSHEYAHAFISRNPQLNPWKSPIEAGALNEGFADIFGILSERYTVGSTSWLIGEEVDAAYGDKAVRDFANPHSSTTTAQAAKYHESGYWDFTGANFYANAGVLTHWFYLLSEGGSYNGVTVPALGMDKADDIAFITMMWWLWPNVLYYQAQEQSINATMYHYGACSKEHQAVVRAWQAVGFGSPTLNGCPGLRLGGARVVNTGELSAGQQIVTFRIINTEAEEPVEASRISWQIPADWGYTLSEDKNELTLHSVENLASQELQALVSNAAGDIDTLRHIVHFTDATDATDYGSMARTAQQAPASESAAVFQVYPNPTTGKIRVYIGEGMQNARLDIYNFLGVRVKSIALTQAMSALDFSYLPAGTYIFRLQTAGRQRSLKININR